MKSIYESARVIMEKEGFLGRITRERDERIARDTAAREKITNPKPAPKSGSSSYTSSVGKADNNPVEKPSAKLPQAQMSPNLVVKNNKPPQDKLNAVQRNAEKSGPDLDSVKKDIAAGSPALSSVNDTNKQAAADKPVEAPTSSGSGSSSYTSSVGKADNDPVEKAQAAATPAPAPAADNTVKDGSGSVIRSGDGSPVKTRTDAEIEKDNKKGRGRGMSMESVNKKFDITDAFYQSVMEVMKKDKKEGSVPRNEKEKDLAKFHGDPNRITHGDVLKARGVTREEAEPVDEMSSKMKMKLGLYGKKKKTNEESVEEGMMSSAKSIAKKVLSKLGGGSDEDQRKDLQRKMGVPQTGKKSVKEGKDTPGNSYEHQCAIHVKSESFGEGRTITTQHANPDADGNIEWYDVMFEHGIERYVPTNTLEILVSEMHGHSKKKKM